MHEAFYQSLTFTNQEGRELTAFSLMGCAHDDVQDCWYLCKYRGMSYQAQLLSDFRSGTGKLQSPV